MFNLTESLINAKKSLSTFSNVNDKTISNVLRSVAEKVLDNADFIKSQNEIDIENAKLNGKSESFIDRLTLSDKVLQSIADGIKQVSYLKSPVDKVVYKHKNKYQRISIVEKNVPFGVVGMIYEARPNVTADAFSLCFKTKNAVVLKGGSEAINSNIALVKCIKEALIENNVDENVITIIEDTSRETAKEFMKMNKYVDLLIPRGSSGLIKSTIENATIPIIETGAGNCHVYIDEYADVEKAVNIVFNAKTQRYSVCNACESLVIHSKILEKALPRIVEKLKEKNVEIRCDERSLKFVDGGLLATEEDFYAEYVDAIISVKTVDTLEQAIEHINEHSTHHSESIVTENSENAKLFQEQIDSSTVYHNCSTRFTDGFVFGFGAEIGISTQKMHARGPMGLDALVTRKFIVNGNGAVRK